MRSAYLRDMCGRRYKARPEFTGESWRSIYGYTGLYEVSNDGRVRSLRSNKILKQGLGCNRKYWTVSLCKNGVAKTYYVHHLVAHAFLGRQPSSHIVCHGRKGSLVNRVLNLYYGTQSQNTGIDRRRDGSAMMRAVIRSDGVEFPSLTDAARESGTSPSGIINAITGYRGTTKAGSFGWRYKND